MNNWSKSWLNFTHDNNKRQEEVPPDLLAPAVHLVDLDSADVAQGDVEEGEAELLETVDCSEDYWEWCDAEERKY